MKVLKRSISIVLVISLLMCSFLGITAFASESVLSVSYDGCGYIDGAVGDRGTWYVLECLYVYDEEEQIRQWHISQNVTTIRYYFADEAPDGSCTWTTAVTPTITEAEANEIKSGIANSMKKWNDVYYYAYDASGNVVKKKVINVIEGTETNHNLVIYPQVDIEDASAIAKAIPIDSAVVVENNHYHHNEWSILIDVSHFYASNTNQIPSVENNKERVGAHELGHVLGLRDLDSFCSAAPSVDDHHYYELMGYAGNVTNIAYQDIAGVAITRGFHTDNDHRWLNCGVQEDGTYKLLCSICNGVKNVSSLSGYTYNTFDACGDNHSISSGNMMAVASYGTKDYYKCKFCKYIAPFSNNVSQSYVVANYSDTQHKYTNNVSGLYYSFFENHQFNSSYICTTCGHVHSHSYSDYAYSDTSFHSVTCSCGDTRYEHHYVRRSDIVNNRARCLGCNRFVNVNNGNISIIMGTNVLVSLNGSYILPDGIVVLADADIDAYLAGTLSFYPINEVPEFE